MIHLEQHGPVVAIRMARAWMGRPLYWTAAYWVDGLLIDTGPRCTAGELVAALAKLPVDRVVITHRHEDHIGGLAGVRACYPDAEVYASRLALATIEEPARLHMHLYRRAIWGMPQPVSGVRSLDEVDDVVRTRSYTFRVIETPGHSPDHISLFEPNQRWLFCGDAFIGGDDRTWAREYDLFAVISSLRTLASLRPERMFPGSGTVRRTPQLDIYAKIGFLIRLSKEVARLDAAHTPERTMVRTLFQGEPAFRLWTLGHYSSLNLIDACRSYNALVPPDLTEQEANLTSPHPPTIQSGPVDSSTSRSPDRDDVLR